MRTRIITLAVLSAALAIGLFGVPLAVVVLQHALAQERAALERVADLAAVAVQPDVTRGTVPEQLPDAKGETDLGLYDHDGHRLIGAGPDTADPSVRHALTGTTSAGDFGDDLVVAVPVAHDSIVEGAVRASIPGAHFYRDLVPTWLAMLGSAGLALAVVWLVARHLARRLAGPLEDLASNAHRLGDGDFSVQTPPVSIPEIDSVGAALNRTARRLDDLISRERAFSADASHQLRTPLTGWRMGLEAALDKPEADLRRAVVDGLQAADRLAQTIDDLLALARHNGASNEQLDLGRLVSELEQEWRPRLAACGRTFAAVVDHDLPMVHASIAAIRHALIVLLDNATIHGAGAVQLNVRDAGTALAIDVSDQGPGIARPDDELFARRVEASSPSHGIGLALARRLVEAEAGRLVLTQPMPPVFTLLLPARESATAPGRGAAEVARLNPVTR